MMDLRKRAFSPRGNGKGFDTTYRQPKETGSMSSLSADEGADFSPFPLSHDLRMQTAPRKVIPHRYNGSQLLQGLDMDVANSMQVKMATGRIIRKTDKTLLQSPRSTPNSNTSSKSKNKGPSKNKKPQTSPKTRPPCSNVLECSGPLYNRLSKLNLNAYSDEAEKNPRPPSFREPPTTPTATINKKENRLIKKIRKANVVPTTPSENQYLRFVAYEKLKKGCSPPACPYTPQSLPRGATAGATATIQKQNHESKAYSSQVILPQLPVAPRGSATSAHIHNQKPEHHGNQVSSVVAKNGRVTSFPLIETCSSNTSTQTVMSEGFPSERHSDFRMPKTTSSESDDNWFAPSNQNRNRPRGKRKPKSAMEIYRVQNNQHPLRISDTSYNLYDKAKDLGLDRKLPPTNKKEETLRRLKQAYELLDSEIKKMNIDETKVLRRFGLTENDLLTSEKPLPLIKLERIVNNDGFANGSGKRRSIKPKDQFANASPTAPKPKTALKREPTAKQNKLLQEKLKTILKSSPNIEEERVPSTAMHPPEQKQQLRKASDWRRINEIKDMLDTLKKELA